MKSEKKSVRIRHNIRRESKRRKRTGAALVGVVLFSITLVFLMLNRSSTNQPVSYNLQPRAALVDQLSLTFPNQTFVATATAILENVGYTVDYFPSENVTVEFFRNLPNQGYSIVILRAHSTAMNVKNNQCPVTIFTSESYDSSKYFHEQMNDQLTTVSFSEEEREKGILYFGVWPSFVTDCTTGRFQDTVIVMMGCEGLKNTFMADAFVKKGAKTYVSWDQEVTAGHTDAATCGLLQHFLIEKQTLNRAVQITEGETGLDPIYGSHMAFYPSEAGEQTIENINGRS